jgi:hypothetical protein
MTDPEYLSTQQAIIVAAQAVMNVDLDGFLSRIRRAESAGPVLDPTLYRQAQKNLQAVKDLAEALVPFKRAAMKLRTEAIMELAGGEES